MTSELPTHRDNAHHDDSRHGFFHLHRSRSQRGKEPLSNKHRIAIVLSYAPDWILTIVVAGLFFLLDNIDGFKREFSLTDTSIQHTFAVHERVTNQNLFLISVVAPVVLMAIINVISIRSFWDLHTSWLGAILGLAITGSVTNIIKVTVGRPRPDCIDRCKPQPGSADHPVFGLVTASICTQTNFAILKDGFRSFPSGHASLSFAGLGFLSFYMAGKLHLFDERGYTTKAWLSIVPLMGASLVAVSRTMDYRHHWQDVLVGSLLGLLFAWFAYRQYYPPLSSRLAHRPFSPRTSRTRPPLPRLNDDHPDQNDHTESVPLNQNPGRPSYEEMELRGTAQGKTADHQPPNLQDVWEQGNGELVVPPGRGPTQLADERV